MDRRRLTRLLLASGGGAALASGSLPAQSAGIRSFPVIPAETAAHIAPLKFEYAPGHVRRYGARGDGVADDSDAFNQAIRVVNAGHPRLHGEPGDIYLCAPLEPITANDTFIDGAGMTLKIKADSWLGKGDGSTHLVMRGERNRISHLVIDGNQAAFITNPHTGRLLQFGNDTQLIGVTVKNSASQGVRSGAQHATCIGCHFDDNANLGMELNAAANITFVACTWNRNGYGFQQSFGTNSFAAFGIAVRYRSHHLSFEACDASRNGREGFALGQGSYACKLTDCIAWMNGDGGFTLHSDVTGAHAAGDGEHCYDIEFNGCEAYNNFGSGLVAFAATYNISVIGGRYYNNHRLAGSLPVESSYSNGIYFAAGSRGIVVRTKAYDDRQLCVISAVGSTGESRQLTVKEWVSGLKAHYPKVALYDAGGAFQGYGQIAAENAGVVTISALPHESVSLGRIEVGWRITQRLQHNGCFVDNNVQACLEVDGFGLLSGPKPYMGWKCISGYFSNGQNVRLTGGALDCATELIVNPSFDAQIAHWNIDSPGGGLAQHHQGAKRRSAGALQLTGGSQRVASADAQVDKDTLLVAAGAFVEASVWCNAEAPGDGGLQLFWRPGQPEFYSAVEHPGGGWKHLMIGAFIPEGVTKVTPRLYAAAAKTCFFDNASLRVRSDTVDGRDFSYPSRNLAL